MRGHVFPLSPRLSSKELRDIPPGMLSSPQIKICINCGWLISGALKENLRSATYDMRLGTPAFYFKNDGRHEIELSNRPDYSKGESNRLKLEPNQLIFVTTIEEFKLPRDIVARFNLKSKWVHHGLLLGTGPIVDPEFEGRLLIPIHNFSNSPLTIAYGDNLIAVEFTKTLSTEYDYVENRNRRGNPDEYFKKMEYVESSVYWRMREVELKLNNIEKKYKKYRNFGLIGAISIIIASLALFIGIIQCIIGQRSEYMNETERINKHVFHIIKQLDAQKNDPHGNYYKEQESQNEILLNRKAHDSKL